MPLRPLTTDPGPPAAAGKAAPEARAGVAAGAGVDATGVAAAVAPSTGRLQGTRQRVRRTGRAIGGSARRIAPFVVGAAAMLAALLIFDQLTPPPAQLTRRDVSDAIKGALASMTPAPALSRDAYEAVAASVVLIQARTGRPDPATGEADGRLGTGVLVSDQGDILTSLHVVEGASTIQLTFADGTKTSARIVSEQPENDIAVLRVASIPAGIGPAVLGNPNRVRVGDEAFVVGSPFGLYSSLSAGVISALDRDFNIPDSERTLTGLIQIDAAVNPGNSGGPLVNRAGQVIGIVAALINPTKQDVFVGIGLAVPIDVAGGGANLPPY